MVDAEIEQKVMRKICMEMYDIKHCVCEDSLEKGTIYFDKNNIQVKYACIKFLFSE